MESSPESVGRHVRALAAAIRERPTRTATVAALDALLRAPLPSPARAFLEAWNAHALHDLRVGGLRFDDEALEQDLRADMCVFGRCSEWKETSPLAVTGVPYAPALAAIQGAYDRSLPRLNALLSQQWNDGAAIDPSRRERVAPTSLLEDLVARIRSGPRRGTPSPILARLLNAPVDAALRSVIEAWQEHVVDELRVDGIRLSDALLGRPIEVYEKDGRGPHADFHRAEDARRDDAITLGEVSSIASCWTGLWVPSSGLQDFVMLVSARSSTKAGTLESLLRREHERAIAAGVRSDLALGP